jgi:protein gp37
MPTKIEWCDETFNPWWGCERVSPGCAHCYAATFSRRLGMDHLWPRRPSVQNGQEHGFRFFGDDHWELPLRWARTLPAKLGRRPRVFCASMADVFEDREELRESRWRLFKLIAETPELDWLILTKRPEFARDDVPDLVWETLPNVWLGVSIETARQTYRADVLRDIPAAVRFISAEPLLGSLYDGRNHGRRYADCSTGPSDFQVHSDIRERRAGRAGDGRGDHLGDGERQLQLPAGRVAAAVGLRGSPGREHHRSLDLTGIDWLIIGGESGPGSRPFHVSHARELIAHATMTSTAEREGIAIFVKQLGAQAFDGTGYPLSLRDRKGGDMAEWPPDLRVREWPSISSQPVPEAA